MKVRILMWKLKLRLLTCMRTVPVSMERIHPGACFCSSAILSRALLLGP